MFWIATLFLLVLGVLALMDRIVAARPDARQLARAIRPAQGWIGLLGIVFGLWAVIDRVIHLEAMKFSVLTWVIAVAVGVLCVAIGFLLAFGLISGLLSSSAAARGKADELHAKLAPYRSSLGMTAVSTAILSAILRLVT